jgi:hypothetical protein
MGRIWDKIKKGFKKAGKFVAGIGKTVGKTLVSWSAKGHEKIGHLTSKIPGVGKVINAVGHGAKVLNDKINGGKGPIDTLKEGNKANKKILRS